MHISSTLLALAAAVSEAQLASAAASGGCSSNHPRAFAVAAVPLNPNSMQAFQKRDDAAQALNVDANAAVIATPEIFRAPDSYQESSLPEVVTQISDGQIQAPVSSPAAPASEYPSAPAPSSYAGSSSVPPAPSFTPPGDGYPSSSAHSSVPPATPSQPGGGSTHVPTTMPQESYGPPPMSSSAVPPPAETSISPPASSNPPPGGSDYPVPSSTAPSASLPQSYPSAPATTPNIPPSTGTTPAYLPSYTATTPGGTPPAQANAAISNFKPLFVMPKILRRHVNPKPRLQLLNGWQTKGTSNYQFQFDEPPQAGALTSSGFSVCPDGNLALGQNSVFWRCLSGTFYNLYDRYWAPQCSPIHLQVVELDYC